MKQTLTAFAAASALLLFAGCAFATGGSEYDARWLTGSGLVTSEARVVPDFTGIEVEGLGDVELSQGLLQSVTVECDDNILPYVKADVVGDTIHLGMKPGTSVRRMTRMIFHITVPRVTSIVIAGSGGVKAMTALRANALSLSIRGSGAIQAQLAVGRLVSSIGGSGDINLSGSADDIAVTIQGSGSVRARALQSATADVRVNGSGGVQVNATGTIGISIAGSGNVEYGGGGRATIARSGSGTARQY